MNANTNPSLAAEFRRLLMPWSFALLLPMPMLVVEQVLLRKDVTGVRRLATSLMPSFAEGLTPVDAANLLGWARSNLTTPAQKQ